MKTIENKPEQGFRDFDLPKEHLMDGYDYVPPKAYDPSEVARRRELNPGTLVLEHQANGLIVAEQLLYVCEGRKAVDFTAETLTVAGLNSAWYSYSQRSTDTMRRRLKLPVMMHLRNHNPDALIEDAVELLGTARKEAERLVDAAETDRRKMALRQRKVGVATGNASLRLACVAAVRAGEFGEIPQNDASLQDLARSKGLAALNRARTAHQELHTHPSLAQLADPYSDLRVHWQRSAPAGAQGAFITLGV